MSGPAPTRQPFVPLAVVTLALVVLALLAGSVGLGIISALIQLVAVVIALIAMALVGHYLWRKGGAGGVSDRRDSAESAPPARPRDRPSR